jgi:hypothetical protein
VSWAADRRTTRDEDEAYCLVGFCDVNMPLIYGQVRCAFVRLQEELLKKSDDASVFTYVALKTAQSLQRNETNPDRAISDRTKPRRGSQNKDLRLQALAPFGQLNLADGAPTSGTTGLFVTAPAYFRHAANYIPHPTLNETLMQQDRLSKPSSCIRRSGHLTKFLGLFWQAQSLQSKIYMYLQ